LVMPWVLCGVLKSLESAHTGSVRSRSSGPDSPFRLSPAAFDEHEGDTVTEHRFVNVLSPSCSSR
jgi:hypothetical protein